MRKSDTVKKNNVNAKCANEKSLLQHDSTAKRKNKDTITIAIITGI